MNGVGTLYYCDPELNKNCKKTNCHINGGTCKYTTNLDYAQQPVKSAFLVLPVDEDMSDVIEEVGESNA